MRKSFWPQLTVDEAAFPAGAACTRMGCEGVDINSEVSVVKSVLFFVNPDLHTGYEMCYFVAAIYNGLAGNAESSQIAQTYTMGRMYGIIAGTGVFEDALSRSL